MLDLRGHALRDPTGRPLDLRPQAFDVLRLLALHPGELVTKEELLAAVWPGLVVTDDSLVQAVGDIRRAFGESGHRLLKTVPRRGYVLVGGQEGAPSPPADQTPQTAPPANRWRSTRTSAAVLAVALAIALGFFSWQARPPRTPSGSATTPSIAVLPFKAPTADGEPLARDIAASLVSELARSPDLRVISSQSSFAAADGQTPMVDIGRKLRSRYLVDGTVRRDGEHLSIVVDLVDSEDGRVLWSAANDVDRDTLAEVQRKLVGRIAGSLQVRVSSREERRVLEQAPRNLDVVVLTARGRVQLRRYTADTVREARRLFQQALEIDPNYALAWVALAQVNTSDIGLRLTGEWDRHRLPEVLDQLQHAIALQPDLPLAYLALSEAEGVSGHFDSALAAAEKCVRLSPNDAGCFYALGVARLRLGEVDAALPLFDQARDRNPIAPAYLPAFHGTALWAARRYDAALRATDECLALAPDFGRCRADRIATLVELGRLGEAREEAAQLRQRTPSVVADDFALGFADSAASLKTRRVAAAKAAGLPDRHAKRAP